jgi:non-heme chloroperoxidase
MLSMLGYSRQFYIQQRGGTILMTAATQLHFAKIELSTGVTLNYLEQGDSDGEPVIMLHGYTDSWHSFALVLPHFSQEYHLFALDQRGHGDSSKTGDSYAMADFAADVISFMDAKGIEQATVVGHSMGSLLAQLVAIHHPERVARLVFIGSTYNAGNAALVELNTLVQTMVDPIDPAFVRDFQVSTLYGVAPTPFMEQVIAESLKAPAQLWRQALASIIAHNTTADLVKIQAPTLIFWGNQDSLFLRNEQVVLQQLIPNTTLLIYEETGHALHWEQPERFVADLEQFLQAAQK